MTDTEPLMYSAAEAGRLLSLSRNAIYRAISRGEIAHLKIGKRILIPKTSIILMISKACKNVANTGEITNENNGGKLDGNRANFF